MMNRGVLARQMFAQGGAAVPNEYKGFSKLPENVQMKMDPSLAKKYDEGGEVATRQPGPEDYDDEGELYYDPAREALKKEIRDWIAGGREGPVPKYDPNKQYFGEGEVTRTDSEAVGMAMGGDPAMAQGVGSMMESVDPAIMQDMLMRAGEGIQDLENVDNYEQMMNMIRGDEASVPERRTELAGLVGEQDAAQTPESVLALVQPVVQIASVDEGIGGLAQETMTESVEGPMAEGIMSTMAPPPPDPAMMGGPPPANFNQGGLVRRGDNQPVQYYEKAGEVKAPSISSLGVTAPEVKGLREVYEQKVPLYTSIAGDPTAGLEEQKKLTQAQMLFDVANTALAFAAPMQGEQAGLSAAERLAMAAQQTKLLPTIGARAQQQLDLKKAAQAEEKKLKLGALTAAEADVAAQQKALAAYKKEELAGALKLSGIGYTKALEFDNATKLQKDLYLKKDALQVKIKNLEADMADASDQRKAVLEADLLYARGEQAKVLEGIKQTGREALQNTINTFKEKMNKLDQTQTLEAQNEQAKLNEQLKILEANMRLTERDLMNAFELKKLDKVHDQNTELQKSRLGVQEDIAANRLSFDENQAKLNQARADKELGIKQENLELQQAAEERISIFEQRKIDLDEREVKLKEEASALRDFGDSFDGNIANIILGSGADKLADAYANDNTSADDTIMLDGILAKYANPDKVWDKGLARYVQSTGRELPQRWREAVAARKDAGKSYPTIASVAKTDDKKADKKEETAPTGTDLADTTYESILSELDAAKGTGAPAAIAKAVNTGFKAVLPFLGKPFKEGSRAAALIKNINAQATIVYMTDVKGKMDMEMRRKIEETLPKPEQWFSTDEDAINAIENTIAAFNGRIDVINTQINNPVGETDIGKLEAQKQSLLTIRNAYAGLGVNYEKDSKDVKKGGKRPISEFIGGGSDDKL